MRRRIRLGLPSRSEVRSYRVDSIDYRSANIELVGKGDIRARVRFCLEVLQRCLAVEGATLEQWVAHTVYGTDMNELHTTADIFIEVFRKYPSTSTWVEIKGLFVPGQMVEITGMAVLG